MPTALRPILAIETSCDDTSVALVRADGFVVGLFSANQDLKHAPYGGIVPEIASRSHTDVLMPLIDVALTQTQMSFRDLCAIAVTAEPGLLGSLLVGVVTAKSLALGWNLPLVSVNHIEGHLLAPLLRDATSAPPEGFQFPYLALAVSGGHTSLFVVHELGHYEEIGTTRDDAAGEAFDKFAKMVGLGYPGGALIDRTAVGGNPSAFPFPKALRDEENLDFSFSGLKSSAHRLITDLGEAKVQSSLSDLCASYQATIVETLLEKLAWAQKKTKLRRVAITGGVSANSELRKKSEAWAKSCGVSLVIPKLSYCTDNAAMIGYAGYLRFLRGERATLDLAPSPRSTARSGIVRGHV